MNVSATVYKFINIRRSWKTTCFNRHAVIIRSHKQRYKVTWGLCTYMGSHWCYNLFIKSFNY